jgi:hypothetical protein
MQRKCWRTRSTCRQLLDISYCEESFIIDELWLCCYWAEPHELKTNTEHHYYYCIGEGHQAASICSHPDACTSCRSFLWLTKVEIKRVDVVISPLNTLYCFLMWSACFFEVNLFTTTNVQWKVYIWKQKDKLREIITNNDILGIQIYHWGWGVCCVEGLSQQSQNIWILSFSTRNPLLWFSWVKVTQLQVADWTEWRKSRN